MKHANQFGVSHGAFDKLAEDRPDRGYQRSRGGLESTDKEVAFTVGKPRSEHQRLLPVLGRLFRETVPLCTRIEFVPHESAGLWQTYRDAMSTGKHGTRFCIVQQVVVIRHSLGAPVQFRHFDGGPQHIAVGEHVDPQTLDARQLYWVRKFSSWVR